MSTVGSPAPSDIFTDNHRWGDLATFVGGHKTLPIRYTLA